MKILVVFDLNFNRCMPRYIGMVFTVLFVKGVQYSISRKLTMKKKLGKKRNWVF